uniref:Uncharacterized protein n=1 Tax=Panagrolaimus sp. ES5 TaxID=591445 RepID=A0AC34G4B7_9BILA
MSGKKKQDQLDQRVAKLEENVAELKAQQSTQHQNYQTIKHRLQRLQLCLDELKNLNERQQQQPPLLQTGKLQKLQYPQTKEISGRTVTIGFSTSGKKYVCYVDGQKFVQDHIDRHGRTTFVCLYKQIILLNGQRADVCGAFVVINHQKEIWTAFAFPGVQQTPRYNCLAYKAENDMPEQAQPQPPSRNGLRYSFVGHAENVKNN